MVHRDSLMLVCLKKERVYKAISIASGPTGYFFFFYLKREMAFFRNLFLLLLVVNAAFLGYDHFKGGDIAVSLVDNAKRLDVPTVQNHLQQTWTSIKSTNPEKLAGHVNAAFDQLKGFNSFSDVVDHVRAKVSGAVGGSADMGRIILEDNVFVLNDKNFDKVIDGSRPALVEFYAPWCGHCKKLAPTYAELGEAFSTVQDRVVIAKVNADEQRDLGARFGIQGFPTLKWFPKGVTTPDGIEDYRGGRDLDSLSKFVHEKSGMCVCLLVSCNSVLIIGLIGVRPRVKSTKSDVVVLDSQNFNSIVKDPKTNVLVEFYAPWCGHCKNLGKQSTILGNHMKETIFTHPSTQQLPLMKRSLLLLLTSQT